MKNNHTPETRFPGFTGDWKQHKLGEILKVNSGRDYKHLQQGNIPVFGTGGYMLSVNDKLSDEDAIGIGRKGTIDKPQLLKAPFWTVDTLFYMTTKEKNDLLFCYSLANKIHWKKYDESTGVPSLSKSSIDKISISIPTSEEQSKIGNFFKQLDDTITLHQQELITFKQTKQGFLQKMFPKEGEFVPEVRFPGFTGDWEQRKVGDFYFFKNGLNKGKEFFGNGTPIVNFTDVFHNRDIYFSKLKGRVQLTANEIKNYEVKKGDIFFTRTSETIEEIGYPSVMVDESHDTVFSGFVLRGRAIDKDPLETNFKRYVFFTENFREEMKKKSSMTTRALTSGTALKEMLFYFPKSKEEQERIGLFFKQLDDAITLHQRELDALKETKKAFLQKMFV